MSSLLLLVLLAPKKVRSRGTNGRERDRSQVSDGKVERMPRAQLLLGRVLCVKSIRLFSGVPCPLFYRQRGAEVTDRRKKKKPEGGEGPSKEPGLPFPLCLLC